MKNIFDSFAVKILKNRMSIKHIALALFVPLGILSVAMVFALSSQVAFMDTSPVCGLEEHKHGPDCYETVIITGTPTDIENENKTSVLICELKEHVHNDNSCYSKNSKAVSDDLGDFLHRMLIKNSKGEVTFDGPTGYNDQPVFFYKESYDFSLTFKSPAMIDGVLTYFDKDATLTYKLPEGLVISGVKEGSLMFKGSVAGYYRIRGNGNNSYIEINLNDTDAVNDPAFELNLGFSSVFNINYCFEECIASGDEVYEPEAAAPNSGFPGIMAMASGLASDTWYLNNFVTGVIVKDKNGAVATPPYYFNEKYTYSISFAERKESGGQFSYNMSGKMIYDLPEEIDVKANMSGTIRLANGSPVGEYEIFTDGHVEVLFYNVDDTGAATPNGENFIHYYTNVGFRLDITAEFKQGTEDGKIKFGVKEEITVTLKHPPAGLKVNKTASEFNSQKDTIDYIITITAVEEQVDNIVLTDALTFNIQSNFKIKNSDIPANYLLPFLSVQTNVKNAGFQPNSFTPDGNNWKIAFPGVTLNDKETIQVKYTLNLAKILEYFDAQGWIFLGDFALALDNTATVTGKDVKNDEPLTGTSKTQTTLTRSIISKTGSFVGGDSPSIKWTVNAGNNGKVKLNNSSITDALGQSQTIINGKSGVTVNVWTAQPDANGVWGAATTLTQTDVDNNMTITVSNFTFNIPTGGFTNTGVSDIYRVEMIFNTTRSPNYISNTTYDNTVDITINSKKYTRKATVTTPSIPGVGSIGLTKNSKWVWNEDGTDVTDLEYTINITVPTGMKGEKFFLIDFLWMVRPNGTNAGNPTELRLYNVLKDALNISISPLEAGEDEFLYTIIDFADGGISQDVWRIYFGSDSFTSGDFANSTWQYNTEKVVTITYKVSMDTIIWAQGASGDWSPSYKPGETVRERLSKNPGWRITNGLDLRNGAGAWIPPADATRTNDYWPIHKNNGVSTKDNSVFDFTVNLDWSPWTGTLGSSAKYSLFDYNAGPAMFEDSFDPRLEYVPNSFYVIIYANNGTRFYVPYSGEWEKYIYYLNEEAEGTYYINVDNEAGTLSLDFKELRQLTGISDSNVSTGKSTNNVLEEDWLCSTTARFEVHYQLRVKEEYKGEYYASAGYCEECPLGDACTRITHYHYDSYCNLANPSSCNMLSYHHHLKDNVIPFDNTATVYATGDKFKGKWSSSAGAEYKPKKAVTKEMQRDGSIATAEIIINPDRLRLRPDNISDPRFTAVDTMSDNMAFYLDSVKIYEGVWNSTTKQLTWVLRNSLKDGIVPDPGELWSMTPVEGKNSVEFELIDNTAVKIVYEALITLPAGIPNTEIWNEIEVYGESMLYKSSTFTTQQSAAEGWAGKSKVYVHKIDEDSGEHLEGAEFALYLAMPHNNGYTGTLPTPPVTTPATPATITVGGVDFYWVCNSVPVSGQKGVYLIANEWLSISTPGNNGVYMIREIKTPNGYIAREDKYFTMYTMSGTEKTWIDGTGLTLEQMGDYIFMKNKSNLADAEILGTKQYENKPTTGSESWQFTFELTQVENMNGDPLSGKSVLPAVPGITPPYYADYEYVVLTSTTSTNPTFKFNIHKLAPGEYYFKVEEIDIPVGWTSLTGSQIIKVVVDVVDGQSVVTYPNTSGKNVTFKNKYDDPAEHKANVTIPVKKTVTGTGFTTMPTFTFHIEELASLSGPVVSPSAYINSGNNTITINTEGGINNFVIQNLPAPASAGATALMYYFRIWEDQTGNGGQWTYDTSSYIVRVVVTYDANKGGVAALTVESVTPTGHSLTTPLLFDNEFEEAQFVDVTINGKKIVEGSMVLPSTFQFKITQVDSGGDAISPTVTMPSPATTNPDSNGDFSFTVTDLGGGETYYFMIEEVIPNPVQANWTYDATKYIVKVVVTNGVAAVNYPIIGTSDTVDVASGSYTYDKNNTYTAVDQDGAGTPYDLSTKIITSNAGETYVGFCAEVWNGNLPKGIMTWAKDRDNKASVLAYSLAHQNVGGLNEADFKRILGLSRVAGYDAGSGNTNRSALMHEIIWLYEVSYGGVVNSKGEPMPDSLMPPNSLASQPEWWAYTNGSVSVSGLYNIITGNAYNNRNDSNEFIQAMKMIKEMMAQYDQGKTTSLNMTYTPTNAASGTITFDHDGFVPHLWSSTAKSDQFYDTTLTWSGTATVTVNGGSPQTNGTEGVAVKKTDSIEVTGISGNVIFTLKDDGKYLKPGSVKGNILESSDTTKQRLIIGHAEFVTLKCELNVGDSSDLTFTNEYKEPGSLTLTKAVDGTWEDGDEFEFEITFSKPVNDCNNTAFTSNGAKTLWKGKLTKSKPSVTFSNIPIGTTYSIKETQSVNYSCTAIEVNGASAGTVSTGTVGGSITSKTAVNVKYTNKQNGGPKLPETGGNGIWLVMLIGGIFVTFATVAGIFYKKFHVIRRVK